MLDPPQGTLHHSYGPLHQKFEKCFRLLCLSSRGNTNTSRTKNTVWSGALIYTLLLITPHTHTTPYICTTPYSHHVCLSDRSSVHPSVYTMFYIMICSSPEVAAAPQGPEGGSRPRSGRGARENSPILTKICDFWVPVFPNY